MHVLISLSAISVFAGDITLPPKRYDHEPPVAYTVTEVPPDFLKALCGSNTLGCTWPGNHIYILEGLRSNAKARLLRHEKGHVNGWQH